MINLYEVTETNNMISKENLDVRTITLGVSLLDCIDSDLDKLKDKIYRKIYDAAKDLVRTGEEISREFGVPIVNKRISVTPMALVGGAACRCAEDFAALAGTLDKVAKAAPGDYDLIIMDLQMPVMDGWEASAAIRKLPDPTLSRIPIIALSANVLQSDQRKSRECGINVHLPKPLELPLLLDTIKKLTGRSPA